MLPNQSLRRGQARVKGRLHSAAMGKNDVRHR
jgi:hypothetical protein